MSELQSVVDGRIDGDDAVEILRNAVALVHSDEAALETRRALIARAENVLLYGAAGRPVRKYPPSFGVNTPA